jgi:hypothetical protein
MEVRIFGLLWPLYQPGLDKGCGHAVVMSLELPARPRIYQVLKQRYLFVLVHLTLFVSNEPVHQLHNPPPYV